MQKNEKYLHDNIRRVKKLKWLIQRESEKKRDSAIMKHIFVKKNHLKTTKYSRKIACFVWQMKMSARKGEYIALESDSYLSIIVYYYRIKSRAKKMSLKKLKTSRSNW